MTDGRIALSATLDSIAAKNNGTILQLKLDGFTTPEDVADLYRMRGKTVAVQLVDPEQPLPLEYDPDDGGDDDHALPAFTEVM